MSALRTAPSPSTQPEPLTPPAPPRVGPWPWKIALALFIAVVGTVSGYGGVFSPGIWLVTVALVVGIVVVSQAVLRSLRAKPAWVLVGGAVALIETLTLLFLPSTTLLGFLPTVGTMHGVGDLIAAASTTTAQDVAPVDGTGSVLFVLCLASGLITVLMDIMIVNLLVPALSGIGLVALAVTPAILKPDSLGLVGFLIGGVGYLMILLFSRDLREDQPAGQGGRWLMGLAVTLLAVALAVSAVIPGFTTGTLPQGTRVNPFSQVSGLSPLLRLGSDLRNPSGTDLIRYTSTADSPPYLRTVTIDSFDSNTFKPTERQGQLPLIRGTAASPFAGTSVATEFTTTQMTATNFTSEYLPAPYAAVKVTGLGPGWRVDPETQSIRSQGQDVLGKQFSVISVAPQLTAAQLSRVPAVAPGAVDPIFLSLPENLPREITDATKAVLAGSNTPYEQAVALQNYFREPDFSYSLQAPVTGNFDDSSMSALAKFLQVKQGYCIHFASAMAVMARVAGIPSRIAVGFLPGRSNGSTESLGGKDVDEYVVDGSMAHAWPELYFQGVGWVQFEPTSSRGVIPSYSEPETPGGAAAPDQLPRTGPNASAAPSATASPTTSSVAAPVVAAAPRFPWLQILVILVVLLAVFSPALIRQWARHRRTSAAASLSAEWAELVDSAVDAGLRAPPGESVRHFAARLGSRLEGKQPLGAVVAEVERERYGPPSDELIQPSERASSQFDAAESALLAQHGTLGRLMRRLVPRSVFRHVRLWLRGVLRRG